jgi:hypothetical protein
MDTEQLDKELPGPAGPGVDTEAEAPKGVGSFGARSRGWRAQHEAPRMHMCARRKRTAEAAAGPVEVPVCARRPLQGRRGGE